MRQLHDFMEWLQTHSQLTESSIHKYTRAINTISNEMIVKKVINKRLLEMNIVEMDIAIYNILHHNDFITKNTVGNHMYSNA